MALANDCTHYYKFNDSTTGTGSVYDELGSVHLQSTSVTLGGAGIIGSCYGYNKTNSFLTGSLTLTAGSGTLSVWANYGISGARLGIYGRADAGAQDGEFSLELIDFKPYYVATTTATNNFVSGTVIGSRTWHNFIITWNSGYDKLYQDGSLIGSVAQSTGPTATPFYIGGYLSDGGLMLPFSGLIDEVGIWNRDLSGTEILSLYNNGSGIQYPFTSTYTTNISDSLTLTDNFTKTGPPQNYTINISDSLTLTDNLSTTLIEPMLVATVVETLSTTDSFSAELIERNLDFTTYSLLKIAGNEAQYVNQLNVSKAMNEFDSSSSFSATINNYIGRAASTYSLNDEVEIYADLNTNPPTTKIFTGIIEDIKFSGKELNEKMVLSGRDYQAILQDIIVSPRIFKSQEISNIVKSLMAQNAAGLGITWDNVDTTTVTLDKITFNNKSLYDCIRDLAELAGFYFYVDVNKDLHFEERNSVSSGQTFSKGNILSSNFTNTDADIFNKVVVYGDRILTGYREAYPTVMTGSIYILDSKPSNVFVTGSDGASAGYALQPGGVFEFDDPSTDNIKWLVDYDNRKVILTSGTAAGNNVGWAGSGVIIDYQRSTPLISIKQNMSSQTNYGRKDKYIIDKNLRTFSEVSDKATSYLNEHKDPKLMGELDVYGVVDVTPGHTCIVDMPFNNVSNQTYTILEARYSFNKNSNLSNEVLKLKLNKKVKTFIDYFKEQELRLRSLESASIDTSIVETVTAIGSIGVEVSSYKCLSIGIGSAFYFHTPSHNILNSSSSLLGDMRAGSEVLSYP